MNEEVRSDLYYLSDEISSCVGSLHRELEDSESLSTEEWENLSKLLTKILLKIDDMKSKISLI
ncbi:hypothetical protein [Siminovitchia sp. 179-K 8D1 HS]|uniref:hypothetical protein n=1 Tax=Siminovitchia sp. 179-K 8D1 HS TaxID=3142385 RepID=UPI00399EEAF2